ncbi:MAG: acyl-CoA dehydrogenase [Pseudonocardia sp. SCN 72-86]|nr:MAG: acyl-CoA dehydrogenase [Pseudonocardia sp. SCN 72-86]
MTTFDTNTATDIRAALGSIIETTVAPNAAAIDRTGAFPSASIEALGEAGILGLLSAPEVGGRGLTLADAAAVVEQLAGVCGSTAMVVLMHFAATSAIEAHGPADVREDIARGRHLATLAFSEKGSRSHFWAPLGSATATDTGIRLDAEKSWVTSAGRADSYVWSSQPLEPGPGMTLWLVPGGSAGLEVAGDFDGFGLRGNASRPMQGRGTAVGSDTMLGVDGAGMDIALGVILPTFLVLSGAFSLGVMSAMAAKAEVHLAAARLEHLDARLADQAVTRADYARLRIRVDEVRAFLADTLGALDAGRPDAVLRVLEVKAVAGEAAADVGSGIMRICGGAAFRKDVGIERHFRDALAARVMAPTTSALYDFVARVSLGMPLFDPATDEADVAGDSR